MSLLVSIFALALACVSVQGDKFFSLQTSSGVTMLVRVYGSTAKCEIITNKDHIDEVLKSSDGARIHTISHDKIISKILRRCAGEQTSRTDEETSRNNGWGVTFPDTKWCGAGDIAANYDDLGVEADTDKCCRAHDHCTDLLLAGETRHNLTNDSKFTKLSCQCDNEFYECLSRVKSATSNTIGTMYFNFVNTQCYELVQPSKCTTNILSFCVKYEKDLTAKPEYQWVSNKMFLPKF